MIYKGKVDWWIGLAIVLGIALPVIPGILNHEIVLLVGSGALTVLMLTGVYPQKYETGADGLRIRAGLTKLSIPWSGITCVTPSTGARRALVVSNDRVMSNDRVLIQCSGGDVVIAPDDQVRFFSDVASHCPQLSRRGMDLVIAFN